MQSFSDKGSVRKPYRGTGRLPCSAILSPLQGSMPCFRANLLRRGGFQFEPRGISKNFGRKGDRLAMLVDIPQTGMRNSVPIGINEFNLPQTVA